MRKLLQYQFASAEPPKADIDEVEEHVRFVPKADIRRNYATQIKLTVLIRRSVTLRT